MSNGQTYEDYQSNGDGCTGCYLMVLSALIVMVTIIFCAIPIIAAIMAKQIV